ncbi:ribosomal protein S18-alanine N-acetyltransferase [Dehalobacter sp. DCM]|uniref:ribosomal protein S18-alanine N-acetyltransferase n=1 Tax=Dehalobacter sp. DCM TaxID=2907827 RepID=UPI00308163FF|nr:ribosomal protein S18-alanine N-acetyltransferase [Dehalobacter sp. DCM]
MVNKHTSDNTAGDTGQWNPVIRSMTLNDIPAIIAIEEASFSTPWTTASFTSELQNNTLAHYFCLELDDAVIGYMGLWVVMGEAHITNIAIWPGCRGMGWGEYLMRQVIQHMLGKGILRFTLEVRVSNQTARNLYEKLGFRAAGRRKNYYSDNQEDAIIMWASL